MHIYILFLKKKETQGEVEQGRICEDLDVPPHKTFQS